MDAQNRSHGTAAARARSQEAAAERREILERLRCTDPRGALADLIEVPPPAFARMRVEVALRRVPSFGQHRTAKLLDQVRVDYAQRIDELTERQIGALAYALRHG